ncbi:MAG: hypothetical protein HFH45_01490 [Bacilli bacterium]|nr:hypothetical protein [Bacilli bacterium]
MYLLEELDRIKKQKNIKKLYMFVDMDGVIADYRFGEGINIKNNVQGIYLKKRPIITTINNLKEINKIDWIELFILSSCLYEEQANEKVLWLQKYAPFFKRENMFFTMNDNFIDRKQAKIDVIKEKLNSDSCNYVCLIDDTHDILFMGIEQLGEKFIPFHAISLID